MNSQKKQFIILIVIVVIAALLLVGINTYNDKQEEESAQAEEDSVVTIYTADTDDITSVTYVYDDETITLNKSDDTWTYEGDESIDLDEDLVETMLSNVAEIKANETISDADDLSEYGLAETDDVIDVIIITTADGSDEIRIGNENEFSGDYYVMLNDDENVYTVDSSLISGFSKSVEDLTAEEEEETEEDSDEDSDE